MVAVFELDARLLQVYVNAQASTLRRVRCTQSPQALKTPRFIALPEPHQLSTFPHPLHNPIDSRLDQSLFPPSSATATATTPQRTSHIPGNLAPGSVLAAHARQDVFARAEGYEQREGDEPDADAEVGRYLRERGHVGAIVDGGWSAVAVQRRGGRRGGEVAEPEEVVYEDQNCFRSGQLSCHCFPAFPASLGKEGKAGRVRHTAGENEDGVGELDDGEVAQVAHVDGMAGDAEGGEEEGEAIDCGEEDLGGDDAVDEAGEEFAREDGVLFDELGEVVESACWVRIDVQLLRGE